MIKSQIAVANKGLTCGAASLELIGMGQRACLQFGVFLKRRPKNKDLELRPPGLKRRPLGLNRRPLWIKLLRKLIEIVAMNNKKWRVMAF